MQRTYQSLDQFQDAANDGRFRSHLYPADACTAISQKNRENYSLLYYFWKNCSHTKHFVYFLRLKLNTKRYMTVHIKTSTTLLPHLFTSKTNFWRNNKYMLSNLKLRMNICQNKKLKAKQKKGMIRN